ncbi:MAG: macrolide ABC transporter ATP-binding protein [Sulfobacillus benefaciens]|uniref:Macrolide ABC transporter ATP-binding protein n=1 Tax=Sulfobacillus benefaciens TaxID=453960 RepID=A0A2T2XH02_9FIRM|nr:MAG: macrolide ABC transporter ATP-binding protein [Sulfobacillus benefaciens]
MMALIEMEQIRKSYKMADENLEVLKGISLTIEQGDYVAIMGPSGSGKSTLMHILGCLDVPSSGHYFLSGQDIAGLSESKLASIRRKQIGFVFQSFNLLAALNALENVALPLLYQGVSPGEQRERATEALNQVGLGERLHHRPSQLSGGQQQRVAIARAIVTKPPVILADEPTGNLDSHAGQEVLGIFSRLHEAGQTVIMITHDTQVAHHANRIIQILDGNIVSSQEVTHV